MIKILIADDSETEIMLLTHIFHKEKDMSVIGCARNGEEAVELASKLKPDIITMDINMPILNGFEAIRQIMMTNPIPIVVITSTLKDTNLNTAFYALDAGALSVLDKPVSSSSPAYPATCKRMITLIRSMAEIKVIKRRFTSDLHHNKSMTAVQLDNKKMPYKIITIGASVGGPQALKKILSQLPADFPVPVVIVQHMTQGFIEGLTQWLSLHCSLTVKCAQDKEVLQAGTVYFAPDHYHLKIHQIGPNLVSQLKEGVPVSGFYPSINVLFNSLAKACGIHAIAILLTGMGSDGASGLFEIKSKNGHTIIQDSDSCVVFGMAGVAQSLGAVDRILKLDNIAEYLVNSLK